MFTALTPIPAGLLGYYDHPKLEAYSYMALLLGQGRGTRLTATEPRPGEVWYAVASDGLATLIFAPIGATAPAE